MGGGRNKEEHMSFINDKTKEINCKIVYFGPAGSGKSTTLRHIYNDVNKGAKGEMVSLSTTQDHTLFFDFVPLNLGKVKGYTVRLHLYTVPGEIGYQQSRMLISKGVDGVVFVADSQLTRMDSNIASLAGLKKVLTTEGQDLSNTPCVFQYNKRDMPNVVPFDEMRRYLNPSNKNDFETVATIGQGIFEAFTEISKQVVKGM